jgi:hypothetical protein
VIIRNVRNTIVQFGDTAKVEKDKYELIKFEQKGDSLIITGHSYTEPRPDGWLTITLPYNVSIETDSVSQVSLQSKQFLKAKITTVPNNP